MIKPGQKPNVFLAGAPKCGTTSLANWLAGHPQCYVTPKKEPHFFGDFLCNRASLAKYEQLFEGATDEHKVRVDASTSYFTMPEAIREALSYSPDARFIVMLRNPVDLVHALHSENLFHGSESQDDFEQAWRLQEARVRGYQIPLSCNNPTMLLYRDQSLLGQALQHLLAQVDRSKVCWVFMEDLNADPRQCYLQVLDFLGLKDDGREQFAAMNTAKRHRLPHLNRVLRIFGIWRKRLGIPGLGIRAALNQYSRVDAEREPLDPAFRWELYLSFADDIRLLEQLTGRNLSGWVPPRPDQ